MILVANADDAGVDLPRGRGILRAAREGIVRSASVLVGFPAAAAFVAAAREVEGLGLGLHLNLSEGRPLGPGGPSLVGEDGRFPGKRELWRRALSGRLDPAEVSQEVEAQWRALESLGVRPTHLDGHNHVHLLPCVRDALVHAVPERTWIRCPTPAPPDAALPEDPFDGGEALAQALAVLARDAVAAALGPFRRPRRFAGVRLAPGYRAADLAARLLGLAAEVEDDEVVEFMVHPGEPCGGSTPFSASEDRAREVEALTSEEVAAAVRGARIRLASFGHLA